MSNSSINPGLHRLRKEYTRIQQNPVENIIAKPLENNTYEWHYIIFGPENTPYSGGIYHGKLIFPKEYPFKPPSIQMITPNGRFKTNTRLCLSMSDFHPESWNPLWSVCSILQGLLSFMLEDSPTYGSLTGISEEQKIKFAQKSLSFNKESALFNELFNEDIQEYLDNLKNKQKNNDNNNNNNNSQNQISNSNSNSSPISPSNPVPSNSSSVNSTINNNNPPTTLLNPSTVSSVRSSKSSKSSLFSSVHLDYILILIAFISFILGYFYYLL